MADAPLSGVATGGRPVAKVAGKAPAVHARADKELSPPSTNHFHCFSHGLIMQGPSKPPKPYWAAVKFLSPNERGFNCSDV